MRFSLRHPAFRKDSLVSASISLLLGAGLAGCSTIYSEVYSYRKTSFDWRKEKSQIAEAEQLREKAQAERNRKKSEGGDAASPDGEGGSAPLQLDSGLSPSPAGGSGLFGGGGLDGLSTPPAPSAPSAIPGTVGGGGGIPGMSSPGMGGGGTVPGMGGGGAIPGMGGAAIPGMGGGGAIPGMSGGAGTPPAMGGTPDAMKPGGTTPPNPQ